MINAINVEAPDNVTGNTSIKFRLYYALRRDVDIEAWSKPNNATISMIPMKPGKTMHYIDCRTDSVKPGAASAGDVIPTNEVTITADILGVSKSVLAFISNFNGEEMFVIWEHCLTGQRFIAGSPCGGLKMTYTKAGTDDSFTGFTLQWQGNCEAPFYYFEGSIPLAAPTAVAADASTFALTDSAFYLLPENTATTSLTDITGVTDADAGRVIQLSGNGSANPSTIDASSTFILRDGTSFVALQGAFIVFEVVKTGAGTYAFYELTRG